MQRIEITNPRDYKIGILNNGVNMYCNSKEQLFVFDRFCGVLQIFDKNEVSIYRNKFKDYSNLFVDDEDNVYIQEGDLEEEILIDVFDSDMNKKGEIKIENNNNIYVGSMFVSKDVVYLILDSDELLIHDCKKKTSNVVPLRGDVVTSKVLINSRNEIIINCLTGNDSCAVFNQDVFSSKCEYIFSFCYRVCVVDLKIDSYDNIFVLDINGNLGVYRPDGKLVISFNIRIGNEDFNMSALEITKDKLYICYANKCLIRVFDIKWIPSKQTLVKK